MELFETPIQKYLNNEINLDEACALLEYWAQSHGGKTSLFNHANSRLSALYENRMIGEKAHRKMLEAISAASIDEAITLRDQVKKEDETVVTMPLDDDEPTRLAPDLGDDQATVAMTNDAATHVLTENDETMVLSDDDGTVLLTEHDAAEHGAAGQALQPGSVIKGRFNLVSVLGEGGMGRVYKAIDMLKVEAKDSNPYVAIKVLSGDFRDHPDAFISLQRETSKAQKLAHPNISTVYDFDRFGDTVYMTMELLEGEPLDEFIKTIPEGGLPVDEALAIIEGLGAGLGYAHSQGLVHSDFKPGNAFILEDGVVKVIDFGIARAAAGTDTAEETDSTANKKQYRDDVFDAGTLGALTPSYATIEMYEGKDPHPSDDIYALACVAVQLLTGKHPFNKKPAPKAREEHLKPPIIPGLDKRQQRGIEKALEFTRDKRTQTMEEFLQDIRKRKNYTKQILLGTLASLVLIAAIGYIPYQNYLQQQEDLLKQEEILRQQEAIEQLIKRTRDGSDGAVRDLLFSLEQYTPAEQASIKNGIRDRAIGMYVTDIQAAVDPENKVYDFERAYALIEEGLGFYPDSGAIKELSSSLVTVREDLHEQLRRDFMTHLLAENFYPDEKADDMSDTLAMLKRIAPEDELLLDPRLEYGYYAAAREAMNENRADEAQRYLETGVTYLPHSKLFHNLLDTVVLERLQKQSVAIANDIQLDVSGLENPLTGYESSVDGLVLLSLPENRSGRQYKAFVKAFFTEFELATDSGGDLATRYMDTFTPALDLASILKLNERIAYQPVELTDQAQQNLPVIDFLRGDTGMDAFKDQLVALRKTVRKHHTNALTHYNLNYPETINRLTRESRPVLIAWYNDLYADLLITDTVKAVSGATDTASKSHANAVAFVKQRAETENDKRIFRNIAADNRLDDSLLLYRKLIKRTDDGAFIQFAKGEISRMYATLAESNATEREYENALKYLLLAKEYAETERILAQEKLYRKELAIETIPALMASREDADTESARKQLAELRRNYRDDYPFIINRISSNVNEYIVEAAKVDLLDGHALKEHVLSILNTRVIRNVDITPLPKPSKLALQGKIEVGQKNLTAANRTLRKALARQPSHYQVIEFRELLEAEMAVAEDHFSMYREHYANEKYQAAETALRDALENWKDNPDYLTEKRFYERVMAQVNAGGKFCREDIKGIGKQNRGACNDMLLSLGKSAPSMVVVPALSVRSEPYAISKYEISTEELKTYCDASRACSLSADLPGNLPATNVPMNIIQGYIKWLKSETGFEYGLATHEQWLNAASAGGREGNTNYNCRLRLGAKLIKGQNIVPVQSGTANNWGLINYVGNADEIVVKNNTYMLAGGNFTDSISNCKVEYLKPMDNVQYAGIRLVRSLK